MLIDERDDALDLDGPPLRDALAQHREIEKLDAQMILILMALVRQLESRFYAEASASETSPRRTQPSRPRCGKTSPKERQRARGGPMNSRVYSHRHRLDRLLHPVVGKSARNAFATIEARTDRCVPEIGKLGPKTRVKPDGCGLTHRLEKRVP